MVALIFLMPAQCTSPLGVKVKVETYGTFSKYDLFMLNSYLTNRVFVSNNSKALRVLQRYASNMNNIMKKFVYSNWRDIKKLYIYMADTKKELLSLFGTKNKNYDLAGFYDNWSHEITLLKDTLEWVLFFYDHEEGHYQNLIYGEAEEFPSEFNRILKVFLLMAIDKNTGYKQYWTVFMRSPHPEKTNRTIKNIGKYVSGCMYFFMIINHFDGDFYKAVEYTFTSNNKTLVRFFNNRMKSHGSELNPADIYKLEMLSFLRNKRFDNNLKKLSLRLKNYQQEN